MRKQVKKQSRGYGRKKGLTLPEEKPEGLQGPSSKHATPSCFCGTGVEPRPLCMPLGKLSPTELHDQISCLIY